MWYQKGGTKQQQLKIAAQSWNETDATVMLSISVAIHCGSVATTRRFFTLYIKIARHSTIHSTLIIYYCHMLKRTPCIGHITCAIEQWTRRYQLGKTSTQTWCNMHRPWTSLGSCRCNVHWTYNAFRATTGYWAYNLSGAKLYTSHPSNRSNSTILSYRRFAHVAQNSSSSLRGEYGRGFLLDQTEQPESFPAPSKPTKQHGLC